MNNVRKRARYIGKMLASNQLRVDAGKSKYVVLGSPQLRIELLKEAEKDSIMMGKHKFEASKSGRYLGDWINEDSTSASITETIDKQEAGLKQTIDDIIDIAENIALKGMNNRMAAIN